MVKKKEIASGLMLHSLRPGLAEIERGIEWTLASHPDVNVLVTPTVIPGGRRTGKCFGWTHAGYRGKAKAAPVQPLWSTREGVPTVELALVAEHLNRPPLDILETVIHECVHLAAISRGIKDCAASGRHNQKFQALAESFGLEVTGLDEKGKPLIKSQGYGLTKMSDALREKVAAEFQPDIAAFNVFRNIINRDKSPQSPRFQCPECPQEVTGHNESSTREATNVICGKCMVVMVVKE